MAEKLNEYATPGGHNWTYSLVASAFFLRLSCLLANGVNRMTWQRLPIQVPGSGACLGLVIAAGFLASLLEGVLASPIIKGVFGYEFPHAGVSIFGCLVFATTLASGLCTDRQTPISLRAVAASLFLILLFAFAHGIAILFTAVDLF